MIKNCLAIETSCDDTSVAIVNHDGVVVSLVSANQDLAHAPYGGVVPEIACRNHSLTLLPLIEQARAKANLSWDAIESIAVTNRPGLIGSLIVGLVTAKSLSQARNLPLIGVNHLEGHILAPFLKDESYGPSWSFDRPFIALAVSGGHTTLYHVRGFGQYEVLGSTLDDAAGEAFDKFGKMLGLGFPGGVKVDLLAKNGNPKAFDFPRGMIREESYMMSFSGLKAAGGRLLGSMSEEEKRRNEADLCASYQEAIVDVLMTKLQRAVKKLGVKNVVITGGVSANSRLRSVSEQWAQKNNVQLMIPPVRFCTDNAAMVGYSGILRLNRGEQHDLSLGPSPNSWSDDFQEIANA